MDDTQIVALIGGDIQLTLAVVPVHLGHADAGEVGVASDGVDVMGQLFIVALALFFRHFHV